MKQWAIRWAERIDAMSLRERAIVFAASALVLLFMFFALVANPMNDRMRAMTRDLQRKVADTRTLQEQVQAAISAPDDDPDAPRRTQIAELKARIADADTRLAEHQRGMVPPERIPHLLEEMLRRDRRLELVALRSLPTIELFTDQPRGAEAAQAGTSAQAGDANQAGPAARSTIRVYRHGVELTVSGGYFELLRYLEGLEQLPYRMFWKDIDVAATDYPRITMKLTVYTLSFERNWVVV